MLNLHSVEANLGMIYGGNSAQIECMLNLHVVEANLGMIYGGNTYLSQRFSV